MVSAQYKGLIKVSVQKLFLGTSTWVKVQNFQIPELFKYRFKTSITPIKYQDFQVLTVNCLTIN